MNDILAPTLSFLLIALILFAMQSKAATVKEYLAEIPAEHCTALEAVRKVIKLNLDKEYEEGMQYGAIGYYVPHRIYPPGYHCDPKQPLPYAGLASRKNYMSLSIMSTYLGGEEQKWLVEAWAKTGKKLDMGAACIRFKKLDDLPLEVIGEAIRRTPAKKLIEFYEANLKSRGNKTGAGKVAAKKKKAAAAKVKNAAKPGTKPARKIK